jgi:tetratricopeptide (TPR) repeat protein
VTDPEPSSDSETLVYDLYRAASGRLAEGNPGGAAELLELAVEREPEKASLREALGRAYFGRGRVRDAREQFAHALALQPSDDYAHFGVGRCHERMGELAEARKYYRLACALSPRPEYANALARVLARTS